jgi:hypothetical protein
MPSDVNQLLQFFELLISGANLVFVFLSRAEPKLLHSMASGGMV